MVLAALMLLMERRAVKARYLIQAQTLPQMVGLKVSTTIPPQMLEGPHQAEAVTQPVEMVAVLVVTLVAAAAVESTAGQLRKVVVAGIRAEAPLIFNHSARLYLGQGIH